MNPDSLSWMSDDEKEETVQARYVVNKQPLLDFMFTTDKNKIHAVKAVRELVRVWDSEYNCYMAVMGLKEAKEFVEAIMAIPRNNPSSDEKIKKLESDVEYWKNLYTRQAEINAELEAENGRIREVCKMLVDRL